MATVLQRPGSLLGVCGLRLYLLLCLLLCDVDAKVTRRHSTAAFSSSYLSEAPFVAFRRATNVTMNESDDQRKVGRAKTRPACLKSRSALPCDHQRHEPFFVDKPLNFPALFLVLS